ncbi:MAG: hypothetical protein ACJAVV_001935 [Alphaproteobacteria bacterium]
MLEQYGTSLESNMQFETPFLIEPDAFSAEQAQLIKETDSTWIFAIPNLVNVGLEGEEGATRAETEEKLDSQLEDVLQTELVIDKSRLQFVSLHIYSKAPFKPSFMAKVKSLTLELILVKIGLKVHLLARKQQEICKGVLVCLLRLKNFEL